MHYETTWSEFVKKNVHMLCVILHEHYCENYIFQTYSSKQIERLRIIVG